MFEVKTVGEFLVKNLVKLQGAVMALGKHLRKRFNCYPINLKLGIINYLLLETQKQYNDLLPQTVYIKRLDNYRVGFKGLIKMRKNLGTKCKSIYLHSNKTKDKETIHRHVNIS